MTFTTIADYEEFIYGLCDASLSILSSTLRVVRTGPAAGRVIGTLNPTQMTHRRRLPTLIINTSLLTSSTTVSPHRRLRSPPPTCRS